MTTRADVDAVLTRRGGRYRSVVAAVRRRDEIVFAGRGLTAGEGSPPVDAETIFEIGSITKVFTGTLLADAVERGLVRLDQPVQGLLPDGVRLPSRGRPITLEDLATHTAGLPGTPPGLLLRALTTERRNPWGTYTTERLLEAVPRIRPRRPPGGRARYSNLGFGLLGHVLAGVAGATYEELLQTRICRPLGLVDTSTVVPPAKLGRFAQGHTRRGRPTPHWDLPGLPGAGAIRSTARDVLAFLAASRSPDSPIAAAARLAHRPRARMRGKIRVGLGWLHMDVDGRHVVWHNGGTGGFRSICGFVADEPLEVVVLAASARWVDRVGIELVRALAP
jgi:CubicO group peptidase (beta-lactamase class C family)